MFYLFISLYITDIHTPISVLRHTKIRFFIQLSKCERLFSMRYPNQYHEYFTPKQYSPDRTDVPWRVSKVSKATNTTTQERRATARLYVRIILFHQNQHPQIFLPTNNIPQIVQTCRGTSPPQKKYTQKQSYPIYAMPVTYMG